jgi:putative tryptophan/tyrosine transport system substrate-binding protein
LAAGSAVLWSSAALAESSRMPVVGVLRSTARGPFENIVAQFEQGLSDVGYLTGQNIRIEYRWADNDVLRLPALAAELVELPVDVVVGNNVAVDAVRKITDTIPIVFVIADDPVRAGLVSSLNRPGGNLTGITFFGGSQLNSKRIELLDEFAPVDTTIVVLNDANYPAGEIASQEAESAARDFGRRSETINVASAQELEAVFFRIAALRAGALLVNGSPLFTSNRRALVELAARSAVPAIFDQRAYVEAGGLMSYGASFTEAYRQAGIYAGRILQGARPADLPVLQPTKFELVINLKTAAALQLEVPPSVLIRADDVIE